MNAGRAKEILESMEMVQVSYQGEPIIIQRVDERTKMARVFFRKNPREEMNVPTLNLIEE
ncbi:H-type small acid-soluble spore protein [Mesobacillus foraminis]|jgi:small acid-soluble spore protein H (minor)|uniref:Small, acid-soluble spore protein H n=1 Tax=Mesobacillus foraminis TaxID=279826 RepID=A0A4R2BLA4_9BACI|nr:H-type small acid-soluble spore protein [Mesobacillus foraminis]MBT2759480.1 H-type small acid-soluble spore protein [Mesobacillus foraminis]TCN28038.1 small acid-soluble spore protein H (minor) [Mesobacillus foraminis]